jgi:hypothetical protein
MEYLPEGPIPGYYEQRPLRDCIARKKPDARITIVFTGAMTGPMPSPSTSRIRNLGCDGLGWQEAGGNIHFVSSCVEWIYVSQ